MVGSGRFAQSGGHGCEWRNDGAVRVWSTKDGQLLHEMRRGAAEGAEGGSGGGDDKAAHDGRVLQFAQSVRAWLRVAEETERPCVEHEGRAAAA